MDEKQLKLLVNVNSVEAYKNSRNRFEGAYDTYT